MFTFAALCPHPPLIIPTIGQNNLDSLATTISSLKKLNARLLELKPATLVIISPHNKSNENFVINNSPKYSGSLENFGDLATKLDLTADTELIDSLQKNLADSKTKFPLAISSEEKIDYGITIPLYYLLENLIGVKFIALHPSTTTDLKSHLEFGKVLQKTLTASDKKIALVASGDLSHKISDDSPVGISPRAKEFDHTLIKLLKHKKINEIAALETALSAEAEECGLKPLTMLLGLLYRVPYAPKILSYEHPFGIGYLTMEMELK
ncbi:MAG TPA: class III extradiol dioxygenase subunit B-like domain-containing protein [Patescibacteria group bacterium]|nr:class III extradiol dioxygenase subunit B-like domain-containing protein [Patescibacteria group bacterium]